MFKTLVISGGSTKGIMALGALCYVESKCSLKHINNYFGTSAGALICLLLAVGYSPLELALCFRELNFNYNFFLNKKDCQFVDYDMFISQIESLFIKRAGKLLTFNEFYEKYEKNLTFVTFNYTMGQMELLSRATFPDMDCIEGVKLSCAIPLLFKKCTRNNNIYIDGGIANNFPLDIAVESGAQNILALKIDSLWNISAEDNIVKIINNSFFIPITLKMREVEKMYKKTTQIINLISDVAIFNLKISDKDWIQMLVEGCIIAKIYLSYKI